MKFKIGDRGILLPTIYKVGIHKSSVGKECVVIGYYSRGRIRVSEDGKRGYWYIREDMLGPVTPVGEQMEFSFMREV